MNQKPEVSTEEHSSIMSCEDRPENPLLIEDTLQAIFEFLTTPDRNIARLVCKFWFDVCNRERFTKKEAFYIANMHNCETVINVLSNSQRKTFNLKFFRSLFDQNSIPLWNTCGTRIESLSFNKCTFHVRIIPIIFEICENLIEFTLRFGDFVNNNSKYWNDWDRKEGLATFLADTDSVLLPTKNIVRKKLTTFCLKYKQKQLDYYYFEKLRYEYGELQRFASIFPGLKIFKLYMYVLAELGEYDFHDKMIVWTEFSSSTFSMWIKLLATKLKDVESLDIDYFPKFCHTQLHPKNLFVSNANELNNVKQMTLPLKERFLIEDESFRTILAFRFWTSFTINCDDREYSIDDLTIVAKLIEANPQLEKLYIRLQEWSATNNMRIFVEALLKSQLQSITFVIGRNLVLPKSRILELDLDFDSWPSLPINNSVRRLEIYSAGPFFCFGLDAGGRMNAELENLWLNWLDNDHVVAFRSFCLKHFRNIHYVNAQPGDLDLVFEYQKNLKQLEIESSPSPARGLSETISIVESLEVLQLDVDHGEVGDILSVYRFPNLKCLVIHEHNWVKNRSPTKMFIDQFNCISALISMNAPNIEFLHIVGNSFLKIKAYIVFFNSCLNFAKLRYVSISIRSEYHAVFKKKLKAEMLKYMPLCTSLRTVWLETGDWTVSLVFNIIDKTFKLTESHRKPDPFRHIAYDGVDLKTFYFPKR